MPCRALLSCAIAQLLFGGPLPAAVGTEEDAAPSRPNVVLILCDNLGYGDLGCYGSKFHRTPHIDRLADTGMRLTDCYASSGVCTPSRASLMTGCYAQRVGLERSDRGRPVLQPVSGKGLHPRETTIAEVLRTAGYATAILGKWHLGDQPQFLPTRQGFDEYFGIPYSDDMVARPGEPWPPLPLMRGEKVVEAPADCNTLTRRYTEEAIRFMERNRTRPFFLYLAQATPGSTHTPPASEAFRGKSANGPYGDSVEELDWSAGEIVAAIERLGLTRKTLVIFTSDNGPPRRNPPQGRVGSLAGWGYSTSEGAMRVPCIVSWPGTIPAGAVSGELCTLMDWLPTLARLAGAALPTDSTIAGRPIDGRDIGPILRGEADARSPHEAFYYYFMEQLQAVRSGRWKLYLPLADKLQMGRNREAQELALFDLEADIGETENIASEHPEVVTRLTQLAERARAELGDTPGSTDRLQGDRGQSDQSQVAGGEAGEVLVIGGKGRRSAGFEPQPTPRVRGD